MPTNWEAIAQDLGFDDEREMLTAFYVEQGWSIPKIAKKLRKGAASVHQRLRKYDIQRRPRGGAILRTSRVSQLSREELLNGNVKELATRVGVSQATIMRHRRKLQEAK